MANDFNKEERVAFEDILEGFNDALVLSRMVNKFRIGDVTAERAQDTMWRPMPYIMKSFDGITRADADFSDVVQLSVPSTIGFKKNVPFELGAEELRDGLQENRLVKGARQKLASDINVALMNTAALQGTVAVMRATAASGYDDVAECDAAFNELGIPMDGRHLCLSTRDYNGMAGNLAARETLGRKASKAYEKAYLGDVAGFDTYKLDYANSQSASVEVTVVMNGANQRHDPKATDATQAGQINVDNRYQTLTVTNTSGSMTNGDCFTIAGVNSVHHITKQDTGQLKTFRVISGGGTTSIVISPAIVAIDASPTKAEYQYQNVTATPANGAALNGINLATAKVNPFWCKDAIELIPARLVIPASSGMAVMHATTDQGVDVMMTRQGQINTLNVKYRLDISFGTVMVQPEMAGIMMFSQV